MGDEDDSLFLFPSEPLGEVEEEGSDHEDCKILEQPDQEGEVEANPETNDGAPQAEAVGEEAGPSTSGTKERKGEVEKKKTKRPQPSGDRSHQPATKESKKSYKLFHRGEQGPHPGGMRKLIETKLNTRLRPRVRDPVKQQVDGQKAMCCFTASLHGHYLHFRSCISSKGAMWSGSGAHRCKVAYLDMWRNEPEKILRPTLSGESFSLGSEICKTIHQLEGELDVLWNNFVATRCSLSCIRPECLRMAACLSVLIRSGVSIGHYRELDQLDVIWSQNVELGQRMIKKFEEAEQKKIAFQMSCNNPYFGAAICHAAKMRKQVSKLLRKAKDKEGHLLLRLERLADAGLDHIELSMIDTLMWGLNRNVQKCDQLFWGVQMRRYVLKVQGRRFINIHGLTKEESDVSVFEEGGVRALDLEWHPTRAGDGIMREAPNEVDQGGDWPDGEYGGEDAPALEVPRNGEVGPIQGQVANGVRDRRDQPLGPERRNGNDLRQHLRSKEPREVGG